ncbi:DJ-1/PfpI family protein [Commensalibacter papalotli (ex Botero et al. 2024)]|uniref:Contains an amidase domain and an AraC-type DNA-binding HTH domain (GlxA) n=1 Tax=Commensalibacter papalotli (ex Botero et al. 2024) TaxID=2972766 RepID=A0ABM9HPE9_9PROT|nr:DJ-1/PfpI family protein [Commensalibacter papalotli (ex Botero et al. 2024)]CAI3942713.1 Transcriptional regulator GlxA [Commensalibacter papalotli (ex Botero et al. 2024)]
MDIFIILFDDFRTLDVFGPVDVFGEIKEFTLHYCSINGGIIYNSHQVPIMTQSLPLKLPYNSVLFIPGGMGTRLLVDDRVFICWLDKMIAQALYCLTVCTGSALLAKTKRLNGKYVTSNKNAWSWVTSLNNQVNWQEKARWCVDGHLYTSSGVSAGIDMALCFVADLYGKERAIKVANLMEYVWNDHSHNDPFSSSL